MEEKVKEERIYTEIGKETLREKEEQNFWNKEERNGKENAIKCQISILKNSLEHWSQIQLSYLVAQFFKVYFI